MSGIPPQSGHQKLVKYDQSQQDADLLRQGHEMIRPANGEAERAMLGAILINNEMFSTVYALARPEDCYSEKNRVCYAAMLRLYERGEAIDFVTLVEELHRSNEMEAAGGEAYATSLDRACTSAWNAAEYAQIVARLAHKRRLNVDLEKLYQDAAQLDTDPQTIVARIADLVATHQQQIEQVGEANKQGDISAADLMRLDLPDIIWTIDAMLPEGLTIMGAPPKTGKSALALQLALSVASGGPALGNYAPTLQGDVLYLALEDSRKRLKNRIWIQLLGEEAPAGLTLRTTSPQMLDGGLVRIESWVRTHEAARMVIIDTLGRFRGGGSATENGNAYTADYQDLARLQALALKHHIAIVVLHHLRKSRSDTDDVYETLSGTTGISGAADCLWILERKREQDQGQLHITGRDLDEQSIALKFEKNNLTWTALGDGKTFAEKAGYRLVYDVLLDLGRAASPSEIAAFTNEKPGTVRTRCWRMAQAGYLLVEPGRQGGKYAIPPNYKRTERHE